MTGYRKSFKSRRAAEDFQIGRSVTPAYSSVHGPNRGGIFVTDPVTNAHGRVYVQPYIGKGKDGIARIYYASYVGA